MENSKQLLKGLVAGNKWIFVLVFLSFVGLLVSSYLTVKYYFGEIIACSVISGCEEFTADRYSKIGPILIDLLSAGYFLALLAILIAYMGMKKTALFKLFSFLAIPGAIVSLALLWLQFFVLKTSCAHCLATDISVLLITASAIFLYFTFFIAKKAVPGTVRRK